MAKKQKNRLPPFVPLIWEMLNHKAYQELSGSAAKALPYFLGKMKYFHFKDRERYSETFEFPYREAEAYGFARKTFARVIRELVTKGFIDPAARGGLKSGGLGCNRFKLSERWREYGTLRFVEREWYQFAPKLAALQTLALVSKGYLAQCQKGT